MTVFWNGYHIKVDGALLVALVGVLGTLLSGLLTHRSGLRARSLELKYSERQAIREKQDTERREEFALRRSTYVSLNQALRNYHTALFAYHRKLTQGGTPSVNSEQLDDCRSALRQVNAEAQMIVTDDVLAVIDPLRHHLNHTFLLLRRCEVDLDPPALLDEARGRLRDASSKLYEVRQTMRKDLGITNLPIERPDGHGLS